MPLCYIFKFINYYLMLTLVLYVKLFCRNDIATVGVHRETTPFPDRSGLRAWLDSRYGHFPRSARNVQRDVRQQLHRLPGARFLQVRTVRHAP